MNNAAGSGSIMFEHLFWLQILGDHARFIYNALPPSDLNDIKKALYFIQAFDQLLEQARAPAPGAGDLNQRALQYAGELREFKLDLLRRHLTGETGILLPPTFLNHMVNEVEEYLRILGQALSGPMPPAMHPVHYHLLWIPDAAGHAAAIASDLDPVEKRLMEIAVSFQNRFEDYQIETTEITGYLRTGLDRFPALTRFNFLVESDINAFRNFLGEILDLEVKNQVLGTLTPLLPDHMLREECYYLLKLSQVSQVRPPNCDPTRPRISK